MILRGYFRSSATWRVRIALGLKALPFEVVPVHLVQNGGEQKRPEHRALNPMAQVPVLLLDDGYALTQSMAILEYLEEAHPAPPLLPQDRLQRFEVRRIAETINSGIQPLQNLSTLQAVTAFGGDADAWAYRFIEEGLGAVAAFAERTHGTFLVGDAPSFADVLLVPQLYNARRYGVPLSRLTLLTDVEARCEALPAFQAARPERQPDFT
jgi:maleylpyruvate isomerase